MERRRLLAAIGASATAMLSGCTGRFGSGAETGTATEARAEGEGTPTESDGGNGRGTTDGTGSGNRGETTTGDSLPGEHGVPSTICSAPIQQDPGVYAITEPAFASDWSDVTDPRYYPSRMRETESGQNGPETEQTESDRDRTRIGQTDSNRDGAGSERTEPGLAPGQTVIGVEGRDRTRAYPVSVLWHHEIVNDTLPGATTDDERGAIIVTYCSLCLSGLVASRVIDGAPTQFAVTGQLWHPPRLAGRAAAANNRSFGARRTGGGDVSTRTAANLVMYDAATRSYWSQLLGKAICGPEAGERLTIVPSTVARWADWRDAHPDTEVLLPPPWSTTTRGE